ncbi:cobalamin 5'-phosphate synthase [Stanieria sp. NIES-3757]|nr:cobalamin 5'-phosphate synthase [Stanieria sp. NIES-3757]
MNFIWLSVGQLIRSLGSALVFYTTIPLPTSWTGEWQRLARWTPLIGMGIGGCLGLLDWGLDQLSFPNLTRSALIITAWIALTGGLHLDGAIDTADGLAVMDAQKRLEVMKDSVTGAFGVMAAVIVLGLKTTALSDLNHYRWLALMLAAGWGRWGQVIAIALYPYLRETGKGAFHKENIRLPQDVLLGLVLLLGMSGIWWWLAPEQWLSIVTAVIGSSAIALGTGYWFARQLGGHTGDTYGAVVEWSEALILCLLTGI